VSETSESITNVVNVSIVRTGRKTFPARLNVTETGRNEQKRAERGRKGGEKTVKSGQKYRSGKPVLTVLLLSEKHIGGERRFLSVLRRSSKRCPGRCS